MIDMTSTIVPKSDQWNADDFLAGPKTITITRVTGNEGNKEQPINVFFTGDDGKPFRPSKSMRRVMVAVWGKDAATYAGKSMTLYRDPTVTWGGLQVGGIRISHMSHIDEPMTMALTATRSSRKPFTVNPLENVAEPKRNPHDEYAREFGRRLKSDPAKEVCEWWSATEADREGMAESRIEKMNAALAKALEED